MTLLSLAPESLRHIARYLLPSEDAAGPDLTSVFTESDSHQHSRIWVNGHEQATRGQDDELTVRDLRSFCNCNRWLRAALREMVVSTIRIVCEATLDDLLADADAIELVHDLRLTPTQFILPIVQQTELLKRIKPGQLRSLSLSLFPFLLAQNLASGFRPSDDVNLPILSAAASLQVPSIRIHTNIAGVAPSLRLLKGISRLEILDEGLYDGGLPDGYESILPEQYGALFSLISQSATSLEHLQFRQQKHETRPSDYAFLDVCNILDAVTRDGHDGLANLRHLELNSINTQAAVLEHIFQAARKVTSLVIFLRTPLALPKLPLKLESLITNCHLPPNPDAIPSGLQTLRVRHDGPLLPSPPDDYVPRLPSTLKCLHANMAPGVEPRMVARLFEHCPLLEDLELLALPLPWIDQCQCPAANVKDGKDVSYKDAFASHQQDISSQLGWRENFSLAALGHILQQLPNLQIFSFNHDHFLAHSAFPDVHHLGIKRAQSLAGQWWEEHEDHFRDLAMEILEAVPQLRVLRWRVCPSHFEAWMTFKWVQGELTSILELETDKS